MEGYEAKREVDSCADVSVSYREESADAKSSLEPAPSSRLGFRIGREGALPGSEVSVETIGGSEANIRSRFRAVLSVQIRQEFVDSLLNI